MDRINAQVTVDDLLSYILSMVEKESTHTLGKNLYKVLKFTYKDVFDDFIIKLKNVIDESIRLNTSTFDSVYDWAQKCLKLESELTS